MIETEILAYGKTWTFKCDGRCDKAFGINGRPKRMLGDDEDDYVALSDAEVGEAPPPGKTVGLSEGGEMKPSATPTDDPRVVNKWCVRECERSILTDCDESPPDMNNPKPNCGWRNQNV
jgi:hypothetical protein